MLTKLDIDCVFAITLHCTHVDLTLNFHCELLGEANWLHFSESVKGKQACCKLQI